MKHYRFEIGLAGFFGLLMLGALAFWGDWFGGKAFMMLNMMRYRDELLQYPGAIKDFNGSPKESNYKYELGSKEIILGQGGYPAVWGEVNLEGRNIFRANENADNLNWNRLGFARYPNRRSFMKLMATPEYGVQSAYKQMGAMVNMIPITPEWVFPDLRLVSALVLFGLYWLICWIRSEGITLGRPVRQQPDPSHTESALATR